MGSSASSSRSPLSSTISSAWLDTDPRQMVISGPIYRIYRRDPATGQDSYSLMINAPYATIQTLKASGCRVEEHK